MIKFWYFVIQNLDKACYINFLIGTLVQLWVACPPYLLISSKHRIQAEKDYNLWTDFKWLCKIFRYYAMTNKFLHRMEIKLMPGVNRLSVCCVHESWYWYVQPPTTAFQPTIWRYWATQRRWWNISKISHSFHCLFSVRSLQHVGVSLICHVGAVYNKSIFSCICQVMKTPQWCVYASTEWKILNSVRN